MHVLRATKTGESDDYVRGWVLRRRRRNSTLASNSAAPPRSPSPRFAEQRTAAGASSQIDGARGSQTYPVHGAGLAATVARCGVAVIANFVSLDDDRVTANGDAETMVASSSRRNDSTTVDVNCG